MRIRKNLNFFSLQSWQRSTKQLAAYAGEDVGGYVQLMELQTSAATLEISVESFQNSKNKSNI